MFHENVRDVVNDPSLTLTVTGYVPGVDAVPPMNPVFPEIETPGGRPIAE